MTVLRGLDAPTGLERGSHLCWAFAGPDDRAAAVLVFLDEGRRRDEQLRLVAPAPPAALLPLVAELPHGAELLASGQLEVRDLTDVDGPVAELEPAALVTRFRGEVERALARGRSGLRVAADVTALAGGGTQQRRRLHVFEGVVDALFDDAPATAMCLYAEALGDDVLGPFAVLHPHQHRDSRPPLVHLSRRGARLALRGELDLTAADDVRRALADLARGGAEEVVLDLSELEFLAVAGARALADASAALATAGVRLRIGGARPAAARCLELFDLAMMPA